MLILLLVALGASAFAAMPVLRSFPGLTVNGVAVDSTGATVVAGTTTLAGFPTTPNAIQKDCRATMCFGIPFQQACTDAYVARIAADGTILYATYFGGSSSESVTSLAVDETGSIYLLGTTSSLDFPFSVQPANSTAPFLIKIAADGTRDFALRLPAGLMAYQVRLIDGRPVVVARDHHHGSVF